MLVSQRQIVAAKLNAWLSTAALLHRAYRVHAVDNRAVISEDALMLRAFDRAGFVGRPCLTVLLEGRARISAYGQHRWLDAPSALVMDYKSAIVMRQQGVRYRALVLEWDVTDDNRRPKPFQSIDDPAVFLQAELLWGQLREAKSGLHSPPLLATLEATLAALAHAGFGVQDGAVLPLVEPVDEATLQLSLALDRALSAMDDQPMVIDLSDSLQLSPRHVQRLVSAFHARYGFNARSWQDTRRRRRVMMGAALMTTEHASPVYVSHVVGYRSPQAFARALAQAGLPSPLQIRAEVARCANEPPPADDGSRLVSEIAAK